MSRKLAHQRAVEIEWEDITTTSRWDREPEKQIPLKVRSVGYLIRRDRRFITISQSHAENDDWSDTTVIPRANVKRFRFLRG